MKRLKNAKDEDNCCAEAETEAEAGEGDDKKGEKGLMVTMEDNRKHSCAVVERIKKKVAVVVIRMWRMFMMTKNDQDDRNDERVEYDDELQETVRTLLEMWKKIDTVTSLIFISVTKYFLKLSLIVSPSSFLKIRCIVDIIKYEWICQYLRFPNKENLHLSESSQMFYH